MFQSSTSNKYKQSAVSFCIAVLLFLNQFQQSSSLIVPNELPSILSLVYSNIPPIKKGTDSRLGFGFRLGEHADFQVLLELGPQKETRPIGEQDDADGSSFNKRQVDKRQQLKVQEEMTSTERSAATWLEKWSNEASNAKKKIKMTKKQIGNKPALDMPSMPQLPDKTLRQLQMLYKMATSSTTHVPEYKVTSITAATPVAEDNDAALHLQQRLKSFKPPVNVDESQILNRKPTGKTKAEITKELMDVNLEE